MIQWYNNAETRWNDHTPTQYSNTLTQSYNYMATRRYQHQKSLVSPQELISTVFFGKRRDEKRRTLLLLPLLPLPLLLLLLSLPLLSLPLLPLPLLLLLLSLPLLSLLPLLIFWTFRESLKNEIRFSIWVSVLPEKTKNRKTPKRGKVETVEAQTVSFFSFISCLIIQCIFGLWVKIKRRGERETQRESQRGKEWKRLN